MKVYRKCLDCGEPIEDDAEDQVQYCDDCWNDGHNYNREDGQ